MKIRFNIRNEGSVLLVSLVIGVIVGITLSSYLVLVSQQSRSIARSQAWNAAVPVMEAGVEEALTHIYATGGSNWAANGWQMGVDGNFHKNRPVGSDSNFCLIAIQPSSPPVISSTAYVYDPLSDSNYVTRRVRVVTRRAGGVGGLTAKGTINLSGGAILDSYDSSRGPYNPAVHGTNGIAISNTNVLGAVYLSGGYIYGTAVTGPGGTVRTSGSAAVGDVNWNATRTGVQPGHALNDANVQFFDEVAPYNSGFRPTAGTASNGTNYNYVLNGRSNPVYYVPGKLTVAAGQSMIVEGAVTLYVSGDFTTSGSGLVYLAPGSSLNFYVGGKFVVSGGGIVNATTRPENLTVRGLNSCQTVTYSGSSAFIGTVNAPHAAFTFSGSAGAFGAFTAKTIVVSGSGGVHYDESLGGGKGLVVASWNEY